MKIQNYHLKISYYHIDEIQTKCILDNKYNLRNGELACYYQNGNVMHHAYMRDGFFCGIVKRYKESGIFSHFSYFSMIEKNKVINKEEHKKELVLLRLGR